MASPVDVASSGDIYAVGVLIALSQLVLPFYNTFLKKQELVKEQNDQFHKRDNHAIEEISKIKERVSYLEGDKDGYARRKAEEK